MASVYIKSIAFILFATLASASLSQTFTKPPLFDNGHRKLEIHEMTNGSIYFKYPNPNFTYILNIVGFTTASKQEAIFLMNECLRILAMEKTAKDQSIEHEYSGVKIIRLGLSQEILLVSDGEAPTFLDKQLIKRIITALESYDYSYQQ